MGAKGERPSLPPDLKDQLPFFLPSFFGPQAPPTTLRDFCLEARRLNQNKYRSSELLGTDVYWSSSADGYKTPPPSGFDLMHVRLYLATPDSRSRVFFSPYYDLQVDVNYPKPLFISYEIPRGRENTLQSNGVVWVNFPHQQHGCNVDFDSMQFEVYDQETHRFLPWLPINQIEQTMTKDGIAISQVTRSDDGQVGTLSLMIDDKPYSLSLPTTAHLQNFNYLRA